MLPDVPQELDVSELPKPVDVVDEQRVLLSAAPEVEEPGDLRADRFDVGSELVFGQQVALVASPRWVADHSSPAAGDGDRPVTGPLEPAKCGQPDEVSDMKRRRAGVDAEIEGDRSLAKACRQS